MSDIVEEIAKDPVARAFSRWLENYDYDGWKELVLWPEDESVDIFSELEYLLACLSAEGIVLMTSDQEPDTDW